MTTSTITTSTTPVPPAAPSRLPALEIKPGQDILALLNDKLPDITWDYDDDLCDCTFQRIGYWTNPYLARTMKVRFCCLWAELAKTYPHLIQEIPAFDNYNTHEWESEPHQWNGEDDMPRALWYRQLAVRKGLSLETIRNLYADKQPPKGWRR